MLLISAAQVLQKRARYDPGMATPQGRPEAIVRPQAVARAFTVERIAPSAALAEFVDYHWLVRWNLDEPHTQQVVPQPRVHVVAESGRLYVHGVTRHRFERRLSGSGQALGTAFHPAGFHPVLRGSVDALADTVRTADEVLSLDDEPIARRILGSEDPATMVAAMEGYLLALDPGHDPVARDVTAWVQRADDDSSITRVGQLADRIGVSPRTLQRLFAEHVGVGPKWVIQRFRILEAAAAAHTGEVTDWARLAHELGFSDQAHLTRVFADVVGTPPATYQREATS
ncbi:helix-turn-helix domain-containing protein [soil metagenome]